MSESIRIDPVAKAFDISYPKKVGLGRLMRDLKKIQSQTKSSLQGENESTNLVISEEFNLKYKILGLDLLKLESIDDIIKKIAELMVLQRTTK